MSRPCPTCGSSVYCEEAVEALNDVKLWMENHKDDISNGINDFGDLRFAFHMLLNYRSCDQKEEAKEP